MHPADPRIGWYGSLGMAGSVKFGNDNLLHTITDKAVAAHPGDSGMRGIADAILEGIKQLK